MNNLILAGNMIDTRNSIPWQYIILHHSYSPDNQKVNDWAGIKAYHMSWRYNGEIITEKQAKDLIGQGIKGIEPPSRDIEYHFGIEWMLHNEQPKVLYRVGRPLQMEGAHTKGGFNKTAIGVCIIGNFNIAPPKNDEIQLFVTTTRALMRWFNIPKEKVIGHWEANILNGMAKDKESSWKIKTCPGTMTNMDAIRNQLV